MGGISFKDQKCRHDNPDRQISSSKESMRRTGDEQILLGVWEKVDRETWHCDVHDTNLWSHHLSYFLSPVSNPLSLIFPIQLYILINYSWSYNLKMYCTWVPKVIWRNKDSTEMAAMAIKIDHSWSRSAGAFSLSNDLASPLEVTISNKFSVSMWSSFGEIWVKLL